MISVKVYKGSPCGWPEVEGLSLFCICPSNRSYRDVFLYCAACVHTGLGAVIGMYGIYFLVIVFLLIFVLYLYSSPWVRAADQKCEGWCPKRSKIETLVAPCSAWPSSKPLSLMTEVMMIISVVWIMMMMMILRLNALCSTSWWPSLDHPSMMIMMSKKKRSIDDNYWGDGDDDV